MPSNKQLQWIDFDFSDGLWEAAGTQNEFAAPPNACAVLTDYQPMKGGGIRAFVAGVNGGGNSGWANALDDDDEIMKLFVRGGKSGSSGDDSDLILVTIDTVTHKATIWRMDLSNGDTGFTAKYTDAVAGGGNGHQSGSVVFFKTSAGVEYYIISRTGGSLGTSSLKVSDNTHVQIDTHAGALLVSQDRLFIANGNSERLYYGAVDAVDMQSDANFVDVAPARGDAIISMLSGVAPSDILVGKEGAPWVVISGDITNVSTPIREMGDDHHQRQNQQQVPRVPGGIAFIEGQGRVFITDGRTFQSISDQIAPMKLVHGSEVGPGTMAFGNDLLFMQQGYVYDFVTGKWFKQSGLPTGYHYWFDPYFGEMWGVNKGSPVDGTLTGALASFPVFGQGGQPRVTTASFQTVPFADKNGRNLDIMEVQFFAQCYHKTEFKVELIDETGASIVTRYVVTGDRGVTPVLFPATKSEYLSIKTTVTAADAASEAPTIERMRIGFGINNIVR